MKWINPMQPSIAGSIALLAWRLLEFYGKDPVQCFASSGFNREQLEDSKTRMSYQVYDEIWACTQRVIVDPCAGLNVTQFWHPATFGVLGYAMLSSSSLRVSLQRMVRYQQVVANESEITLTETAKGLLLEQPIFPHQTDGFPLEVDVALVTLLHICRFNYGDVFDPVEVNLRRSKPGCAGRYYAFYRCPVNFSADANNMVLPIEAMDKPLPGTDQQLTRMHNRVLQKYLEQQQSSKMVARVRESIVAHLPSGDVNKQQVAKALHMSTRTLQRRLQEEGSSFVEILNKTRRELALQYIQDDSLPLKEVSYLLGYSNSTSFSKAFKRWTGKKPSTARI
jgi:AraC-like DNA-binding protein